MEKRVQSISHSLAKNQSVDISCYESGFLLNSIDRRMKLHQCKSTSDYLEILSNSSEPKELIDSLHIGYSEFFRNTLSFAVLEQLVIPLLASKKQKMKSAELRIWSAACAAGQEVYSLAMLLDEWKLSNSSVLNYRIFATDNSLTELTKAQTGIYQPKTMGKTTMHRMERYFTAVGDNFQIDQSLKKEIEFVRFDLLEDSGYYPASSIYGNFDLIICSNLLFYYNKEAQSNILAKISKAISPGGYLVTGEAEREILIQNDFYEIFEHSAIFRKKNFNDAII